MNEYSEIKRTLRKICRTDEGTKHPAVFAAEVVAVDRDARTCTVTVDGTLFEGVRLRGLSNDGRAQMLVLPKVGGDVVLADVSGDGSHLIVVGWTEIDGVKIDVGDENLAEVLSDFIDETAKIIVVQGTTPDVKALENIKRRLNEILK